jgi:hypothetical protein
MAVVQPVASRKRGGAGRVVLIVLGAVGIVAGVLLWFLAGNRYDDAVKSLAPAPVDCETTLEFDDAGTYTFFVETKGEVGAIDGSCASTDREYDYTGDALPRVSLTLLDDGGEEVDLDRVDEPTYDSAGRSGTAVRTADIDDAGTYSLTVEANDPDVMVRVGKDPQQGVGAMRVSGMVLAIAGVVALVLGLVLGRAKPAPTSPTGGQPSWQPSGGPPPVAPPYARPPAPPYGSGPAPASPPRPAGPSWGAPGTAPPLPPRGGPLPPPPPRP